MSEILKIKPSWLDLNKYNYFQNISPAQWSHQLAYRRSLTLLVFSTRYIKNKSTDELMAQIIKNPLLPSNIKKYSTVGWSINSESENETSRMFKKSLQPLTFMDLNKLIGSLPDSYKEISIKKDADFDSFAGLPVDNFAQIPNIFSRVVPMDSDLIDENIFHICLDLELTDKELVKDFKAYLKAARTAFQFQEGQKIKSSKAEIKKLTSQNVMPYLDLSIWAKMKNKVILQHDIGDWLFPDENIDVTEKIRKSTLPTAKRSLTANFIKTLSSLPE